MSTGQTTNADFAKGIAVAVLVSAIVLFGVAAFTGRCQCRHDYQPHYPGGGYYPTGKVIGDQAPKAK